MIGKIHSVETQFGKDWEHLELRIESIDVNRKAKLCLCSMSTLARPSAVNVWCTVSAVQGLTTAGAHLASGIVHGATLSNLLKRRIHVLHILCRPLCMRLMFKGEVLVGNSSAKKQIRLPK